MQFGLLEIFLVLLAALAAFASYIVRLRLYHLNHGRKAMLQFFEKATPLVRDERVPDQVVDLISFMSEKLRSERFSRSMLKDFLSGQVRDARRNPLQSQKDFNAAVRSMPLQTKKKFDEACMAFFLSVSYRDTPTGWVLRRIALIWLSNQDDADHAGRNTLERASATDVEAMTLDITRYPRGLRVA